MQVVKKTGLVPVHTKNDNKLVFGVPPAAAQKGVKDGTLFLYPIPEDVETYDFATPAEPKVENVVESDGVVVIPADWETLHYAKQIVIAKTIIGGELPEVEDKKPTDVARDVIRDELSRRAAGNPETPVE